MPPSGKRCGICGAFGHNTTTCGKFTDEVWKPGIGRRTYDNGKRRNFIADDNGNWLQWTKAGFMKEVGRRKKGGKDNEASPPPAPPASCTAMDDYINRVNDGSDGPGGGGDGPFGGGGFNVPSASIPIDSA